jgi:hypothetical protein
MTRFETSWCGPNAARVWGVETVNPIGQQQIAAPQVSAISCALRLSCAWYENSAAASRHEPVTS